MYLQVVLDNGAGTVSSNEVNVRTLDGGESFPRFYPNYYFIEYADAYTND